MENRGVHVGHWIFRIRNAQGIPDNPDSVARRDEVREKRGLAYTVGATRLSGKDKGMFCLFAGTHAEATEAVETEMAHAVQRILERKLTKEEFDQRMAIGLAQAKANQSAPVDAVFDRLIGEKKHAGV